ncbi:PLP-dependent transferase [Periconia macrospinosa]|uniref:PLP-dependent transferase n=1 Tax=Periconia macrospinosa TaxID=97972 RepID=A0A2V1E274_9PLEO|nr:PLP-dependent transferase [Periconia macrospinosa]
MESIAMEPGLSARMTWAMDASLPLGPATFPSQRNESSAVINLSNAQNEVLRPELLQLFKTVVDNNLGEQVFAHPSSLGGDATLREAVTSFLNRYFHPVHPVQPEQIVLTAGASDAIESVIQAICDPDDYVLIPGPHWDGYTTLLKSRSVNAVVAHPPTYTNHDNYLLPSLQAAYDFSDNKSRIKAVLLCNPQNPTSKCYDKISIVECMEFCQERGLHFISDETLALCSLQNPPKNSTPFVSALSLTEPLRPQGAVKIDPGRVHVIWTASKLFGCSGFRVGCLISQQNPELINSVSTLTWGHVNGVAALYVSSLLNWSQLPTIIALNSERLTISCRLLEGFLSQWNVEFIRPTNGIVLFAKLAKKARSGEEEIKFCRRLAVYGLRVSPGYIYNGVEREFGWVRIRFSCSRNAMERAIEGITGFLKAEGYQPLRST